MGCRIGIGSAMNTLAKRTAQFAFVVAVGLGASACQVVDLSDLGWNPFASNEDVPPPADPSTAAGTYVGPAPTDPTSSGFGTGTLPSSSGITFMDQTATSASNTNVAPGSDPRPTDPNAARAYDMIVARAQADCAVAPLIVGFGRVNGGYNANASCPSSSGSGMTFGMAPQTFSNNSF